MKRVKTSDVSIGELKAHLSSYLVRIEAGETLRILRRREPVAELRAVSRPTKGKRPVGLCKGIEVPASFFDPLPEEFVASFEQE